MTKTLDRIAALGGALTGLGFLSIAAAGMYSGTHIAYLESFPREIQQTQQFQYNFNYHRKNMRESIYWGGGSVVLGTLIIAGSLYLPSRKK